MSSAPGRLASTRRAPHVAAGCGGCGWQHVDPAAQQELKAGIVADALQRIGHLRDLPDIDPGPALAPFGYRTTVRGAVADGRFAFRRAASHDVVAVDGCLTAHPLVTDIIDRSDLDGADGATIRVGVATGERLVVLEGGGADAAVVPDGVVVVDAGQRGAGADPVVHEVVAGRRWRISSRSFFQARPDGAEALVAVARQLAGDALDPGARLIDLYAGVGLFAGALGGGGSAAAVVAVEGNASAVRDARANLADLPDVTILKGDVGRWRPTPADLVVADPARTGLGPDVVGRIAATGARRVLLVSCDAGALGRDAALLDAAAYQLAAASLVDLFPQTPHVEVVSRFDRR